jgi:transcription elongation factor Elf1
LSKYLEIINILNKNRNIKSIDIKSLNKKIDPNEIYIPKLICISSFIPYPMQFRTILEKLVLYSNRDKIIIPIEKEIENLVLGIPFPKKCFFYPSKRSDFCIEANIDFLLRDLNKYNFYSYKMKSIFIFKIDDIIEIFKNILLEKPILIFSQDKEKLTNIFESFLSLIFPFQYQNPHCAILPDSNAGIIEQSKSFFFGINQRWAELKKGKDSKMKNYFCRLHLNLFKNVLICDADSGKIAIYQGYHNAVLMTFDEFQSNNYPNLSPAILSTAQTNNLYELNRKQCGMNEKYTKKLKNKLEELFPSNNKINYDYSEKSSEMILEPFCYFIASILKNYNDYLYNSKEDILKINNLFFKKDLKKIKIEEIFKVKQFKDKEIEKKDDPTFYEAFFDTNLFKNFLFRKYRNNDKPSILLFDETIIMKKNKSKLLLRNIQTEFINAKHFGTTVNYEIGKTQNFTKSEHEEVELKKNELINYYQKYDGKNFYYYIFPKLLYDNKFFKNKISTKYLFNHEKINQIIESNKKNLDLKQYYKIYEGPLVKRYYFDRNDYFLRNEMNYIIESLWLSVFCFTFWYCDDTDKKFRFQELMNNLKRIEIPFTYKKIIDYIYMTLIEYGNDYMIINFYDYLNRNDYNDYALYNHFCNRMLLDNKNPIKYKYKMNNLVLKKLDVGNTNLSLAYYKDKYEDELDLKNKTLKLSLTIYNNKDTNIDKKNILTKRSFNDNFDDNTSNKKELIIFDSTIKCPHCKKETDITRLVAILDNMHKMAELTCIYCNNYYIPNSMVKVGSYAQNIRIYNPYYLFHSISLQLIKKYGSKIDLDILKEQYPDFYWNCILYFSLHGYSFDMLIKYKKEKEEKFDKENKANNSKNNMKKPKGFYNLSFHNQNINFNS